MPARPRRTAGFAFGIIEFPSSSFDAFRMRRVLRTARVQLQARAIGEHIAHPAGVHATLRNAMMRGKTAEDSFDTLQCLYGGTGLSEPLSSIDDSVRLQKVA
jgi:hypothetical protein